jgi:hypothetical protein
MTTVKSFIVHAPEWLRRVFCWSICRDISSRVQYHKSLRDSLIIKRLLRYFKTCSLKANEYDLAYNSFRSVAMSRVNDISWGQHSKRVNKRWLLVSQCWFMFHHMSGVFYSTFQDSMNLITASLSVKNTFRRTEGWVPSWPAITITR